jgi:CRP/FNR family transcriptional regulator, cyclic AMP receptor protein
MAEQRPPPQWISLVSHSAPGNLSVTDEGQLLGGPPPLLQGLTQKEVTEVMSSGKRRVLQRGARVFSQGRLQDGIYLIESGRVRVFYAAPSGREITLAYWSAGNFVGGPEVFKRGHHIWSGDAATNCTVYHLPGDALWKMVTTIPGLALGIIMGLTFKGKCYSAMAQMLGTQSATERLAHLLLHLMDVYGVKDKSGGTLIASSFTHADLAHMTGVTRQWVTTSLKRMTQRGILLAHGPNLVIMKPDLLTDVRDGNLA